MRQRKLIFSSLLEKRGLVVNYLDVGARGDIYAPWSLFQPDAIKVVGFEPDEVESARLSKAYPGRRYYPNALWGGAAQRSFYLCEWASTSSMYPPNESVNKQYRPQHWTGRVPAQTLQVDCVALDTILAPEDRPDFIKIDTQGAELEILKGASGLLRQHSPLVLAETWCAEVYSGMPLTHDVMRFMHELGYAVFDLNVAAAWQHQIGALSSVNCKAKTIGFDLLFVKRLDALSFESLDDLLKFAGLCELFGFRDYAIAALERSSHKDAVIAEAIGEMVSNDRWERSFARRAQTILMRLLRRDSRLWPTLH